MINPKRFAILSLFAMLAAGALAQAEDAQLRKEIQAVYTKWDKLCAKGDINALLAMLDPSFVGTDANGKVMNYADTKKTMQGILKSFRDLRSKITVNQIQTQGGEVVAWITMKVNWKTKRGGKWEPASYTADFAETLKRIGGVWKFIASQALPDG